MRQALSSARKKKRSPNPPIEKLVFGGKRIVFEALRSQAVNVQSIFMTATFQQAKADKAWTELMQLHENIRVEKVDEDRLTRLVGYPYHQGVGCLVNKLPEFDIELMATSDPQPNLMALDQVQDPMNLGAVLRSANACKLGGVMLPKDRSAPLNAAAIKASAGAALHTPVGYVTNLAETLRRLKDKGYWVIALDSTDQSQPIDKIDAATPWILLAGSEAKGIRPLVYRQADYFAHLPMLGEVESLNVSAASAVALFSLCKNA